MLACYVDEVTHTRSEHNKEDDDLHLLISPSKTATKFTDLV